MIINKKNGLASIIPTYKIILVDNYFVRFNNNCEILYKDNVLAML